MQAFGFEQRGQQGVLVFAVAVLVVEDVCGGVGLVAADAEREADVAEIFGDEVVEGLDFIHLGVEAFGEFCGFGADFRGGRAAVFFQAGVPAADLFPADEGGQLNVGPFLVGFLLFLLFFLPVAVFFFVFVFVLVFVVVFAFEVRAGPVVDAASVLF